jgi:hypothetical protein
VSSLLPLYLLSIFFDRFIEVWDELWLFICILAASLPNILLNFYFEEDESFFDPDLESAEVPTFKLYNNILFDAIVSILKHFFGEY